MPQFFLLAKPTSGGRFGIHCKPCPVVEAGAKVIPLGSGSTPETVLEIAAELLPVEQLYICPHCMPTAEEEEEEEETTPAPSVIVNGRSRGFPGQASAEEPATP